MLNYTALHKGYYEQAGLAVVHGIVENHAVSTSDHGKALEIITAEPA